MLTALVVCLVSDTYPLTALVHLTLAAECALTELSLTDALTGSSLVLTALVFQFLVSALISTTQPRGPPDLTVRSA